MSFTTKFRELKLKKESRDSVLCSLRHVLRNEPRLFCLSALAFCSSFSFIFNCFCFNVSGVLRMTEWAPWLKLLWCRPLCPLPIRIHCPTPSVPPSSSPDLPPHALASHYCSEAWIRVGIFEQKIRPCSITTFCGSGFKRTCFKTGGRKNTSQMPHLTSLQICTSPEELERAVIYEDGLQWSNIEVYSGRCSCYRSSDDSRSEYNHLKHSGNYIYQ